MLFRIRGTLGRSRLAALLFVTCLSACGSDQGTDEGPAPVHGLNFGPYTEGADPTVDPQMTEARLQTLMAPLVPYTEWIRTYGSTSGLERAGSVAHRLGLKVAAGAWLGRDRSANAVEVVHLTAACRAREVDIAIVGSEVLARADLTVHSLIDEIARVRASIPEDIPVTTAEPCHVFEQHPELLDAVDVVFVNAYPYWDGTSLQCATRSLHRCYQRLRAAVGDKPIVISETGWPSCGRTIGRAVPSPENASLYFRSVVSWARANAVPVFYFEAYDEPWKARYEGPQGACFGIRDQHGQAKPGMDAGFDSTNTEDNWSDVGLPGGVGTPSIAFTTVPAYGSFDRLVGQVEHLDTYAHSVAVYIYVGGGWWTKPYFDHPLVNIDCDGGWSTSITTGGIDQTATQIAAFVLPSDYRPPALSGADHLPASLFEDSLARAEVTRQRTALGQ
jgi:exo-beta-1,3-glucanase (GH17 family)